MPLTTPLDRDIDEWLPRIRLLDAKLADYLAAIRDQLEAVADAVSAPVVQTLGASAQILDMPVDGETDRLVRIYGYGPTANNGVLTPSGNAGALAMAVSMEAQTDAGALANVSSFAAGGVGTAFEMLISLKTGAPRMGFMSVSRGDSGSGTRYYGQVRIGDTSTPITNIRIASGSANTFSAGFRVITQKLPF